jgi:hypothetical protein
MAERPSARRARTVLWLGVFTLSSCSSQTTVEEPGDAGFGGVFMGDDGAGPAALSCMTSAACEPGQVCCGKVPMNATCQTGPCPNVGVGPIQLCGTAAECLEPGATCGPPPVTLPVTGITICNPPLDAGTGVDGGSDADASGSEGSSNDGAPPAEDASPSDGGTGDDSDLPEAGGG